MTKPKKKTGCIIAVIVCIVLIAVPVAVLRSLVGGVMQSMQVYPYGEAAVKDLSSYVNVSGSVSSSETIEVTAELQEKISLLNVKVGDSVKKGDVLCEFDSAYLQEQFDRLSETAEKTQDAEDYQMSVLRRNLNTAKQEKASALDQAQRAIRTAENTRDQAYQKYNNNVELYNQLLDEINAADSETAEQLLIQADGLLEANDALYPQLGELDNAVTAAYSAYREAARAGDLAIQAAQDAIDASQFSVSDTSASDQLKKLQEQIDGCIVTAPADGVVTKINVAEGSIPYGTILMTIENTESLMIRGTVGEADILRISEGMSCEIKTTATDQEIIPGTVGRIERFISEPAMGGESAGYKVEISIDDPNSPLLIGMSANIKIILNKAEQVLSVPYDAIRGGENEGYFVFACVPTDTDGMVKIVKKNVEIGFEGDFYTEITGGDLKEGDILLTNTYGAALPDEGTVIPDPSRIPMQ